MKKKQLEPEIKPHSLPGEGGETSDSSGPSLGVGLPKIYYQHWVHVPVQVAHEYRLEGASARLDALVRKSRWLWSYSCEGRAVIVSKEATHFARMREVSWRVINWAAPDYPGRPGVNRAVWRAFCAWETTIGGRLRRRGRVVLTEELLTRDERRWLEAGLAGDTAAIGRLGEALGRVDVEVRGERYRIAEGGSRARLARVQTGR